MSTPHNARRQDNRRHSRSKTNHNVRTSAPTIAGSPPVPPPLPLAQQLQALTKSLSVDKWSVEHVCFWLRQCDFSRQIQHAFKAHRIDGRVLMELTEEDLRREPLRLNVLGDIKRLSLVIQELRNLTGLNKKKMKKRNDKEDTEPEQNNEKNTNSKMSPSDREEQTDVHSVSESDTESVSGEEDTLGSLWEYYLPSLTIPSPEVEPWSAILSKLFVSIFFFFMSIFVTALVMTVVHERIPDPTTYPPLPDILLDNLPLIPWAFAASEVLAICLLVLMIGVLFVHKYRSVIMRRMCAVVGTVFLLRCVTMFVTSLSVPGKHLGKGCMEVPILTTVDEKLHRAWLIASHFGLSIAGQKTCGDYMFSGHSSVLTLLNLFITEYTPKSFTGLHIMTWTMNLFGMFFVLAAHEHYSLDVFLAFYISSRMFHYYHHHANIQHALDDIDKDHKSKWFIYLPLFSYLEENMNGKLPNEYEWPWTPFVEKWKQRQKEKKQQELEIKQSGKIREM